MHTERTQNAHTQTNIYAAHTYQHRTREHRTAHREQTENTAQPQHRTTHLYTLYSHI